MFGHVLFVCLPEEGDGSNGRGGRPCTGFGTLIAHYIFHPGFVCTIFFFWTILNIRVKLTGCFTPTAASAKIWPQ